MRQSPTTFGFLNGCGAFGPRFRRDLPRIFRIKTKGGVFYKRGVFYRFID
eukprot:UN11981